MENTSVEINWKGPYTWLKFDTAGIQSFEDISHQAKGIYLWTVEFNGGYLVYAAGITRRTFYKRFKEHTTSYLSGVYTIFDVPKLKQGVRHKLWAGFWMKKRSVEMVEAYMQNQNEIIGLAQEQLANFRIFIAEVDTKPRLLERLEAAIMNQLYLSSPPICDIPDKRMMLSPRWKEEEPIRVKNTSAVKIWGIADEMVV